MDLLRRRTKPSFGWVEGVVLGLYAILAGVVTHFHEPWSDEAQAWLIARDSGLGELFVKRLHYEGSPGLWHLLLWVFARLHMSFTAMHWATALIGVVTAYVVLRYSPFPLLVRVLLPLSFPLFFQTAIIARSYSLVPLLAFLACIVLCGKRDRPLTYAVLLGLIANTSLFAFLVAVGMVPLYWFRLKQRGEQRAHRSLAVPGVALALLFLFAMYTALPATDITYGPGRAFALHRRISHVVSWITQSPWPTPSDPVIDVPKRPVVASPADLLVSRYFGPHISLGHKFLRLIGIVSIAFYSVSDFNVVAIVFYAALLIWQRRHRALITSLPLLMILVGGQYLGVGDHHTSIVAVALIVGLWLTWWSIPDSGEQRMDRVFQIVLLAVLLEQTAWTAHAVLFDIHGPFDGSVAMAHFILPKADHERVASIGINDAAIQAYANHNLFVNQRSTYWPWKIGSNPDEWDVRTVGEHPDMILDSDATLGNSLLYNQIVPLMRPGKEFQALDMPDYLSQHGYRETHRFCGRQPAHFGYSIETCLLVYEPFR